MKIKYCGPALDYSGYGEANRHDIGALAAGGIELTTQIPVYCLELSDYGRLGELARSLEHRQLGYKIKIIHTTPNVYQQFMEPGIYHIGRVFWETDKLPLDFASKVQMMDEIWTGSEYNKAAIRNAGVTKPVYIIPEAVDIEIDDHIKPYLIAQEKTYKFYSIFEWTERKNPQALLEAYWREFTGQTDVSLTIKTYIDNFTPEKRAEIRNYVRKIKKTIPLPHYPPVYLFTYLMDRRQIYRFHMTFDCFISPHRGEGWGIPQMEAMLAGNPIISTKAGGIHEYLTHGKDAILLDYTLIPIRQNNRNQQWYTNDQHWADVKIDDIRAAMRWAYEKRSKAEAIGKAGGKLIREKFSLPAVGGIMRARLRDIQKSMEPNIEIV